MNKLKPVKINSKLMADVLCTCGSIYRMNAPHAIGYLFNPVSNRKSIATGMFCDYETEINSKEWTYFFDFKTKTMYKI